ncbi:PLP-dependent aminotransferase family protein [Microlunatus elymi]|uniref:PLP-dependent aminotransferase family protein n=1 Tax=Microlunatus elymi TaxID=2596828 RepID=A0A516Q184_9ACTN|nr:PLP-dependent aminotransferase family protein [Microlunatus elymi]QDP97194.1 PLP-dependent aminotransferase family protein [Microlunatus elymi]
MSKSLLAKRATQLLGSVIDSSTSLLQKQSHDIVRFAMGSPAAEAIPDFEPLAAKVLGAEAFDYAATEGDPGLRDALLEMLDGTSDRTVPERLTITAGGMQGLDIFGKLFIDPGDLVIVESPTYTNGSATALSYGAELAEVGVDADGMIIDELIEVVDRAGRAPKAIYVIPSFQNPSGTTLSLERRQRLIELARRWGSMIIDDDPYGLLRFGGDDIGSLRSLSDGDPLVFAVRTFSKIIAPGLRVGWVDTAPQHQQLIINAKQAMDTCTNLPGQRLVAAFLAEGGLDQHLRTQRERYRERRTAMQTALADQFGSRATWTDPDGGFFLWVTIPGVDTQRLFAAALAEGVAYIPGPAFSPTGRYPDALRLCFASTPPDRIVEGVARLRRALDA